MLQKKLLSFGFVILAAGLFVLAFFSLPNPAVPLESMSISNMETHSPKWVTLENYRVGTMYDKMVSTNSTLLYDEEYPYYSIEVQVGDGSTILMSARVERKKAAKLAAGQSIPLYGTLLPLDAKTEQSFKSIAMGQQNAFSYYICDNGDTPKSQMIDSMFYSLFGGSFLILALLIRRGRKKMGAACDE